MLRGERVGLRAIEPHDIDRLRMWRNRPDFRRYFREYRELSSVDQERWYREQVLADSNTRMFSVVDLDNHALLGACGLCYIDWIRRSADLSVYIGHDDVYIDSRYAPDAARVLIRYSYDELGLHRLWAEVYEFDERKIELFGALGFSLDGRFRDCHFRDQLWCDSLFFSLLSTDDAASRGSG